MIYPSMGEPTHFYGTGAADPLRDDLTLQSLEAKSTRLLYLAAQQKCLCLNLSTSDGSRMVFPRIAIAALEQFNEQDYQNHAGRINQLFDFTHVYKAIQREQELAFYIESGRYWEHLDTISLSEISILDDLWIKALVSEA